MEIIRELSFFGDFLGVYVRECGVSASGGRRALTCEDQSGSRMGYVGKKGNEVS